jgi:hypothetical protein
VHSRTLGKGLAQPKWRARLASIMPGINVALSQPMLSLLMSVTLLVVGWGALYLSRSAYTVEGTIRAVVERTYPWNIGGRFDIVMELKPDQWLRFPSVHGARTNAARLGGACVKPGFPIGGTIRLKVYGFVDPIACPDLGRFLPDFRCLPRRWWRQYTYISAIEVGGQPVVAGWSPNLCVLAPFGLIAAISWLLAWHNWQLSSIPARTLILYAMLAWGCILWPIARYF